MLREEVSATSRLGLDAKLVRQTACLGDEVLDLSHGALEAGGEIVVVEGAEVAIAKVGRRQFRAGRAVRAHRLAACSRNQKAAPLIRMP